MASSLINVKDVGASKLRMPQIRGWVAKGLEVEVKDAMVRFGWLKENGPGEGDLPETPMHPYTVRENWNDRR